jgi:hypothetical protein
MLDDSTLSSIFANIEDILLFNTVSGTDVYRLRLPLTSRNTSQALLSSLEDRQRACRLYVDQIGDISSHPFPFTM